MEPIDPAKLDIVSEFKRQLYRSPKVNKPALNHIGLWVDNIENAVEDLSKKGIQFTPGGIRLGAAGHKVAFIHPKSAVGVLVELVQAPVDVIEELSKQSFNNDITYCN